MRTLSKILAASAGALALAAASAGHAATISIWIDDDGAAGPHGLVQVASGINTAAFSGAVGGFMINHLSGSAGVSPVSDTQALDTVVEGPGGDLDIFVSASDLTAPLGNVTWLSTFQTQPLGPGWTLTERTWLSTTNTAFSGILLGNATMNPNPLPQQSFVFTALNPGSGPYSINTEYTIHATGPGSANSTIDVFGSAAPEPATWGLMIIGFGGLGAMVRRRRQVALTA